MGIGPRRKGVRVSVYRLHLCDTLSMSVALKAYPMTAVCHDAAPRCLLGCCLMMTPSLGAVDATCRQCRVENSFLFQSPGDAAKYGTLLWTRVAILLLHGYTHKRAATNTVTSTALVIKCNSPPPPSL